MIIEIECRAMPTLSRLIGKRAQLEMPSGTLAELVDTLIIEYGPQVGKVLLDEESQLDITVQVMINNEGLLARNQHAVRALNDGDSIKFILLVGGG
jgi:sulfur carrier protein ThiS